MVDFKKMNGETNRLINELGFHYKPTAKMRELTVSDMQIIEIIKAISRNASLIIMDEPTSSITESEVAVLFEQIHKLKKSGVSIIYITHKMDEVFQIGDVATVLRDGNVIETQPISQWSKSKLIAQMVGREMNDVYPVKNAKIKDIILEVKNLQKENVFKDIGFKYGQARFLGLRDWLARVEQKFSEQSLVWILMIQVKY